MKHRLPRVAVLGFVAGLLGACVQGRSTANTSEPAVDDTGGGGGAAGASSGGARASAGGPTGGGAGVTSQGGGGAIAAHDAGASGGAAGTDVDAGVVHGDAAASDAGGEPGAITIVAVGYSGRRVTSRDLGRTWFGDQTLGGGGDDQFLLRAAAIAHGVMVAVGWKFLSSLDGRTWTENSNPHGQWQGGVAWGNNMFVACGGLGNCARSTDGKTWARAANAGGDHLRQVTFRNGEFWTTGDAGTVFHSPNGTSWQQGGSYPGDLYECDNVQVRLGNNGVQVSENNGGSWRTAMVSTDGLVGIAVGHLPP